MGIKRCLVRRFPDPSLQGGVGEPSDGACAPGRAWVSCPLLAKPPPRVTTPPQAPSWARRLYAFVVEGLLSALATQVSALDPLVKFFVRASGYSLVVVLGASADDAGDRGPGSFSGPFIGGGEALLVLLAYLAVFVAVAAWSLRRRDVV